jgi:uncharacterized protein YprB with RNaseH-like and TPR domain
MLPEQLKRRISSSLHRAQAGPGLPRSAAERPPRGTPSTLEECFPEGRVEATSQGEVFVCQVGLSDIVSRANRLIASYREVFDRAARLAEQRALPSYLGPLAHTDPAAAALIDTETAGFHGRPLFLIGLLRYENDDLFLTQHFACNYAQEVGLLEQFASLLPEVKLLVSFNGKAFDWPFVRDRMVYHRLRCEASFDHLDLLHPSRRRWRERLPNCKLQTLERYLCGRWRSGDIPSEEIPQRYHDFVRRQDARLIAPIFHHNRMDLITMVELLIALVEDGRPARSLSRRGVVPGGGFDEGRGEEGER